MSRHLRLMLPCLHLMCILFDLDIVCRLEGILQSLYVFFAHSLKKFMER